MALETKNRQLAAIVFSDITGYTSMMQKDEAASLILLDRYRECHESESERYHGEIVQYYGDACLMTFQSVVEAMKCCHALQLAFKEDPQVPVRIGLHLGDIVHTNDNIFGDAVNVASRVESMGIPGNVLFSLPVQQSLTSHPEFTYQSLGAFEFKNVEKPLEIFALTNDGLPVPRKDQMKGKLKEKKAKKEKSFVSRLLPFLIGIGVIGLLGWYLTNSSSSTIDLDTQKEQPILTPIPVKEDVPETVKAINSFEKGTFTDARDGTVYPWVQYADGTKWMAQNLSIDLGRIPCYDNAAECDENGRLYTWHQAIQACPSGWRLPQESEWSQLIKNMGGRQKAYVALMDAEISGFSAMLGGRLDDEKKFDYINEAGNYWTATSVDHVMAEWVNFSKDIGEVSLLPANKKIAFSCRCLEDLAAITQRSTSTNNPQKETTSTPLNVSVSEGNSEPNGSQSLEQVKLVRGKIYMHIKDESGTLKSVAIQPESMKNISADLKIGAKKTSNKASNNSGYQIYLSQPTEASTKLSHEGGGYLYELIPDEYNLLASVDEERYIGVEADLKIAKSAKPEKTATNEVSETRMFLVSGEPLDGDADFQNITSASTNEDIKQALMQKFGDRLIENEQAQLKLNSGNITYSIKGNQMTVISIHIK